MQKDAIERLDMRRMLLEPELLEAVEPDVHLVNQLSRWAASMPTKTRDTARQVVRRWSRTSSGASRTPRQAVAGALNRGACTRRPRPADIDWDRTIRRNLKHYQPELRTIIPETLLGHGRRARRAGHVIIAVDQSGSMAASIVYSACSGR